MPVDTRPRRLALLTVLAAIFVLIELFEWAERLANSAVIVLGVVVLCRFLRGDRIVWVRRPDRTP